MFAALRFRNFRLLWLGLAVSFTGSFMQTAAILWHISLIVPPDRKGLALGLVGLVRAGPIILLSVFAGVAADVIDRRKMMLLTQVGGIVVAAALAALAFAQVHASWPVYLLAALGAAVSAFDPPARHAMVAMLVPPATLPNAISLNAAMMQIASVLGPALGGLLIAASGVGWTYAFNAASFLFVVIALLMMRDVPAIDRSSHHARDQFSLAAAREGLHFVFRHPIIRSTMLLDFFATFFASAMALLPIFAQDVLHVGARGYGLLSAAPALGAMLGSLLMLPITHRIRDQGVILLWAVAAYGLATLLFGASTIFWVACAALAATGMADAVSMVIRNLARQVETPDAIRGRMVGVNMIFFLGGPQLGELEAGAVAQWLGAHASVIIGGFGCLIATAVLASATPELRSYRPGSPRDPS